MSPSTRTDRSLDSGPIESDSTYSRGSALQRELTGIVLVLFALFLAGALAMQGIAMLRGGDITRTFGWAGRLLAYPMARFLGWPAAALIPVALAAHALRLFGRLAERTDRSWMVFLLGLVVLLPVGLGLGQGGLREATNLSGLWGSFAAFYLLQFAGTAGAWIIVALSLSALMAATLSWNPVRALVAPAPRAREAAEEAEAAETRETAEIRGDNGRKRRKSELQSNEPTPEEMPA
ncbi:MAG TPA: hypothetical protein VKO87_06580, partial [Gemmatimonadaceae bacterium]|nr:hypothetical protein [Gemmatimonadaceae bacterium]